MCSSLQNVIKLELFLSVLTMESLKHFHIQQNSLNLTSIN